MLEVPLIPSLPTIPKLCHLGGIVLPSSRPRRQSKPQLSYECYNAARLRLVASPPASCQADHNGRERETGRGATRAVVGLRARPSTVPRNKIRA